MSLFRHSELDSESSQKILIVDDDNWFANSLRNCIKFHKVGIINHADDIFPAIEKFKPDILILDLVLNGKNAITFLNEFASYDDMKKLQIFVLSSVANDINKQALLDLGVEKVFDKSTITPEVLQKVLQ